MTAPQPPTQAATPKSGMCTTSLHRASDCSGLPFWTMPLIAQVDGIRIVCCTDYERQPVTL